VAISGRKPLQGIAADHSLHPIQVSKWKKQMPEGARKLIKQLKKSQVIEETVE